LLAHPWPGNVRELEHAVERALLLSEGEELGPESLGAACARAPAAAPPAEAGPLLSLKQALEQPERDAILRALRATNGHRDRAAELLGINRATLYNKLRKHGLGRRA
jgi:DNA-binding NtrC family response regulator